MKLYRKFPVIFGLFAFCYGTLEFLWPLNNETYSFEVQHSTGVHDSMADCTMTFGQSSPLGLTKAPIFSNGFTDITVSMATEPTVSGEDFSFSGWFKFSSQDGALFHYKSEDSSSDLREVKVVLISQHLQMTRILSTSETNIGNSSEFIPLNTWYYISVGVDRSNGKLKIEKDESNILDLDDNFASDVDFALPGTLRIGGTFDYSHPRLTGYVTCFSFHISNLLPKKTDSQFSCESTLPSFGTPYSPQCPNAVDGVYFVKSTSYYGFEVLHDVIETSVFQCALRCLRHDLCTGIQYNVQTQSDACSLLRNGGITLDLNKGQIFAFH